MQDIAFMARAIHLASLGEGNVAPNPLVGCVIVSTEGKIIGEGWHKQYGGPHAEIEALNAIQDKENLKGATVFVTLEPCAHYGKTPPCALALAQLPIHKVVAATSDPNPLVAGKGFEILRAAGIGVEVGLLEKEAQEQNKIFLWNILNQKPYVSLKWATSADGFMAPEGNTPYWLSGPESRIATHRQRANAQAILIGYQTLVKDQPKLDVRFWPEGSKKLLPIIWAKRAKDYQAFNPELFKSLSHPPLFLLETEEVSAPEAFEIAGAETAFYLPMSWRFEKKFSWLLAELQAQKVAHLIVEGGAKMLQEVINSGLWNEALEIETSHILALGLKKPVIEKLFLVKKACVGADTHLTYTK